jgi:hypothetical protein
VRVYRQILLKIMMRISRDKIGTVLIGEFTLIAFSEENHEDLAALEGGCV